VIYETDGKDIINQYIVFCKVFDDQRKKHGLTQEAVEETIRICKDRNILKDYLDSKEKEVVTIMMSLFDEEQIMKTYVKDVQKEAAKEGEKEGAKKNATETAKRMFDIGLSFDEVAKCSPSLSVEELREIEAEVAALV
jgi:hypothetical protein